MATIHGNVHRCAGLVVDLCARGVGAIGYKRQSGDQSATSGTDPSTRNQGRTARSKAVCAHITERTGRNCSPWTCRKWSRTFNCAPTTASKHLMHCHRNKTSKGHPARQPSRQCMPSRQLLIELPLNRLVENSFSRFLFARNFQWTNLLSE